MLLLSTFPFLFCEILNSLIRIGRIFNEGNLGSLQGGPNYEVHLVLPADLVASSVVPFPLFFPCLVRVVHVDEGRKVMRFKAVSGNCFGNHAGFVCIIKIRPNALWEFLVKQFPFLHVIEDSGASLDDATNPEPCLLGSEAGFLDFGRYQLWLGPELINEDGPCDKDSRGLGISDADKARENTYCSALKSSFGSDGRSHFAPSR